MRFVLSWALSLSLTVGLVQAQDEPAAAPPLQPTVTTAEGGEVKAEDISLPDEATAEQLHGLLERADQIIQTREDLPFPEQVTLWVHLVLKTSDRLLEAPDATEEHKETAERAKFIVLYQGARMLPERFTGLAKPFFAKVLETSPNSELAPPAAAMLYNFENLQGETVPDDAVDKAQELLAKYPESPVILGLLPTLAQTLEQHGQVARAKQVLESAIEKLGDGNPEVVEALRHELKGMEILGSKLEIAGPTLGDQEVSLADMKGKVVLVDFWATWCGPCIQELPNLKEVYEKYHDQGFEIIAVSLDDDLDVLKGFVERSELPWPQVFFAEQAGSGKNPLAEKYNIEAIPAMFLVGKDGKVISRSVRGEGVLEAAVRRELGLSSEE